MAANASLATNNSNYNELSPREKRGLDLSSKGDKLIAKEKDKINGLTLKDTDEINKFELKKGIFKAFDFIGGGGRDSLVIGEKAKVRGGTIDLGSKGSGKPDGKPDVIEVKNKGGLIGVTIKNFGSEDKLKIDGKTYTGEDVKNGQINGLGGIRFE